MTGSAGGLIFGDEAKLAAKAEQFDQEAAKWLRALRRRLGCPETLPDEAVCRQAAAISHLFRKYRDARRDADTYGGAAQGRAARRPTA